MIAGYEGTEHPALTGLILEIPRTGHIALTGPSGAGKATWDLLTRLPCQNGCGGVRLDWPSHCRHTEAGWKGRA